MTPSERLSHLSIHDVAPATLDQVEELLERLSAWGHQRVLLLVIPGADWQAQDLARLRGWVEAGHPLAGHGWCHHVEGFRKLGHALHGLLFSRNVAEHLALDRAGVRDLVQNCADWFAAQGLPQPTHYVPPAWAMGALTSADMQALPFETYESFRGTYDAVRDRFVPGPLVGFEADTRFRAFACRLFNRWNLSRRPLKGPLRIALHPNDLHLLLRDELVEICQQRTSTADPRFLVEVSHV